MQFRPGYRVLRAPAPPGHWRRGPDIVVPHEGEQVFAASTWEHSRADLRVLRSISSTPFGDYWHVSLSRFERLPSWAEVRKVADEFIGHDVECVHSIPTKADYVNVHRFCLHIWAPVKGGRTWPILQDITLETGA